MTTDPSEDVLRWVQEGERLFGQVLQTLRRYQEVERKAEAFAEENRSLREAMQAIREELHQLRTERIEAAQTLKAFAEQVTKLATLAIQRLGKQAG
jgi:septal ring factor EnvC (AmiA/AmiB activator)